MEVDISTIIGPDGIIETSDPAVLELKEKHGGSFLFRLHMNEHMRSTPLEALELGQRSYNCLKRAGYSTIGELVDAISGGQELKGIRNCRAKSVREIMEQLFLYQYNSLRPENQDAYLMEVIRMNVDKMADDQLAASGERN